VLPYCPLVGIIYIDMYVFVYLNCQALESPKRYAMKAATQTRGVPRSTNTRRERSEVLVEIHVSSKVLVLGDRMQARHVRRNEVRSAHVAVGWGWGRVHALAFLTYLA